MSKLSFVCAAAYMLLGCGEKVNVEVHCKTTTGSTISCDVVQTAGKAEIEACWDLKVTCGNGAIVTTPRNCQKVKDGKTETYVVPKDKLIGLEACGGDKAPTMELLKLTLDGDNLRDVKTYALPPEGSGTKPGSGDKPADSK